MNIRPANPADRPAIIELLRLSLGETLIPKSEGLWAWKHEENPFGISYVLLAEENATLIGLRAFMQWQWKWNNKVFKTIRAVDTATHPQHQGKGIFKKLTLEQLELCRKDDIRFVFNTPNSQSLPGYLKMGWKVQGKMPLKIQALRPVSTGFKILLKSKNKKTEPLVSDWPGLLSNFANRIPLSPPGLHTPYSSAYIHWRYAVNPLFPYSFITDDENYFLIYRIKEHSRFSELRIADVFIFNRHASIKKDIHKKIKAVAKQSASDMLAISGQQWIAFREYLPSFGIIPVRNAGPAITLRKVTAEAEFETLMDMSNWSYSMGDLELF